MEEKKYIKISLSNLLLLLAIIVIIIMAYYIYVEKKNYEKQIVDLDAKTSNFENTIDNLQGERSSVSDAIYPNMNTDLDNDSSSTNNIDNYSKIYSECEKQCKGVIYRREFVGSSFFFIKDGILYAGEEDIVETHSKTSGIIGTVKNVVPLDKQTNKTIALTDDGKLYINKEENEIYGISFERILSNYEILEILEFPNESEFKYLCSDGKIIDISGKEYLNLLNNNENSLESKSQILSCYKEQISMYNDSNHQYSIADINDDGIPELFIYVTGSLGNEIIAKTSVYTYVKNKGSKLNDDVIYVGDIEGRIDFNTILYKMNDGSLLSVYGYMGFENLTYYKFENNSLTITDTLSKQTDDYISGDNEIVFISCSDTSLIDEF